MKTVKRKAKAGEKIHTVNGSIGEVMNVWDDCVGASDINDGIEFLSFHTNYEVIIEDEPKTAVTNIGGHRIEIDEDNSVREYGPPTITVDEPAIPPHSSHYHQNGLDPLEVMRRTFPPEQYEGFLRGSLLKYTMRYDRKGQQQEDLEKLNFYGRELEEWKNALKDVDGKVIEAEGAE